MKDLNKYYGVAIKYHGQKYLAIPMGFGTGFAAPKAFGAERAKDEELIVESEEGENSAADCFVDGVMVATGATLGESNIRKLICGKMALVLIDERMGRTVRVFPKPNFFEKPPASLEMKRCSLCGEAVFTDRLKETGNGKAPGIPCSEAEVR